REEALDRRLEPRRLRVLGEQGKEDRLAQPLVVDSGRERRLFGVAGVERRGDATPQGRLYVHDRSTFRAGCAAWARGRLFALSVHIRRPEVRRSQLDDRQRTAPVRADRSALLFRRAAVDAILADGARRCFGGIRWGQLRLQHGQYLLLLPGSREG